jgi:1,2-diacylglycerol 3-beta-galactosyltransferase
VDYVDIWSHYTPYPFNQIPRSYSFMVAHPALWKFNYYLQQPRWVHVPTQRMWAPFVSRQARACAPALPRATPFVLTGHA